MIAIHKGVFARLPGRARAWKRLAVVSALAVTATLVVSVAFDGGGAAYSAATCPSAQSDVRGQCVWPLVAHIDSVPAFACVNALGALGDRMVNHVCTESAKEVSTARGAERDTR